MADKRKKDVRAVGNRIKEIRKKLGLNMEDFGKIFDPPASKGAVSNWENGYNLPNNSRLKTISEKGNVSMFYLLNGSKTFNDLSTGEMSELYHELNVSTSKMFYTQQEGFIDNIKKINFDNLSYKSIRAIQMYFSLVEYFNDDPLIDSYLATIPEYLYSYAVEKENTDKRKLIREDLENDFEELLDLLDDHSRTIKD